MFCLQMMNGQEADWVKFGKIVLNIWKINMWIKFREVYAKTIIHLSVGK